MKFTASFACVVVLASSALAAPRQVVLIYITEINMTDAIVQQYHSGGAWAPGVHRQTRWCMHICIVSVLLSMHFCLGLIRKSVATHPSPTTQMVAYPTTDWEALLVWSHAKTVFPLQISAQTSSRAAPGLMAPPRARFSGSDSLTIMTITSR